MPSAHYAFRMDYDRASDKSRLSDWFSANASNFLVTYEEADGENPHVHAIFISDKSIAALRASFKRSFEDKRGNGAYSLKQCTEDPDSFVNYICKGSSEEDGPVVEFAQGFEYGDDRVAAAHEEYWVNNASLKASAKARAATRGNMVEVVEKLCKEEGVRPYDRKGIARVYIREMKKARKPINIFAARAVVNGVVVALDDDSSGASEDIVSAIANI